MIILESVHGGQDMHALWEFISPTIPFFTFGIGFGVGLGLGLGTIILLATPRIVAALAKLKFFGTEVKGLAELSEAERMSLRKLVAILTLYGPKGPMADRKRIAEILRSEHAEIVIGIGEGISKSVQHLIRAFRKGGTAYAEAIESCRRQCRYIQLVDGVSDDAIAQATMKIVAPVAMAAEDAGAAYRRKAFGAFKSWWANWQSKRAEKAAEKAKRATEKRISFPAVRLQNPGLPRTASAPSQTSTKPNAPPAVITSVAGANR
ncbi:MAG TPA: hypothetical protein VGF77_05555 [Allosphingosinicella sp.]|jgi:hypothetical protein